MVAWAWRTQTMTLQSSQLWQAMDTWAMAQRAVGSNWHRGAGQAGQQRGPSRPLVPLMRQAHLGCAWVHGPHDAKRGHLQRPHETGRLAAHLQARRGRCACLWLQCMCLIV